MNQIFRWNAVNVVDGEMLYITKVSRLHMAAYLCVASNGVPPSISKRVQLRVQCKRHNIAQKHIWYLNETEKKKKDKYTVIYLPRGHTQIWHTTETNQSQICVLFYTHPDVHNTILQAFAAVYHTVYDTCNAMLDDCTPITPR